MWREAKNIEDGRLVVQVCEEAEPQEYPISNKKAEGGKTGVEFKSEEFVGKNFFNSEEVWWIYENNKKKIVVSMERRPNELARILRVCPVGFSSQIHKNWESSFPLCAHKVREIVDAWGVKRFLSRTPMTLNGECAVYFAQAYMWEFVSLTALGMNWVIDYDRNQLKKPVDENEFKVLRVPTIEADAIPVGYKIATLIKDAA